MSSRKWVDSASDAAFCVNGDMIVTGWNEAAEELLGYSASEAVGKKCGRVLQAVYPNGAPLCSPMCEGGDCLSNGRHFGVGNTRLRCQNGEFLEAGISSLVLPQDATGGEDDSPVAIIFLREATGAGASPARDSRIRVFTLGRFAVTGSVGDLEASGWKRKQSVLVLKCLLSHLDRPVHRECLIEWLWPDAEPAIGWSRLKVALSALRSELRKGFVDPGIIETVGQSYLLRSTAVWMDAHEFGGRVSEAWHYLKQGESEQALARFEDAETLYHGDFFEDERFAEWCSEERERLREVYLDMLAGLSTCYMKAGRFSEACAICHKALTSDPCRESFVRMMIECFVCLKRPDRARSKFIAWRQSLERDYDLQPTKETLDAFARLTAGEYSEAS
ncbi:MAG: BTAD domain-containing putative transcriptional regulator [Paracoccaceae bacterium]